MTPLRRRHHVAIVRPHDDVSAAFCVNVLGLRVMAEHDRAGRLPCKLGLRESMSTRR